MNGRGPWLLGLLALLLGSTGSPARAGDTDHDPWATWNRAIFAFNDTVDVYALEPAAKVWDRLVPNRVQRMIRNVFDNAYTPLVAINNLLQGKPHNSAVDVARFMANSTFGLFGLFDVAEPWGLEKHEEDFGQTLAVWGVPSGPYLVLPFVGPSSPRDAVGYAVDSVATVYWFFTDISVTTGLQSTQVINSRAQVLDAVRELKAGSVDYYAAVRNGYLQRRKAQIQDRREGVVDEDLYRVEDEDE